MALGPDPKIVAQIREKITQNELWGLGYAIGYITEAVRAAAQHHGDHGPGCGECTELTRALSAVEAIDRQAPRQRSRWWWRHR